MEKVSASTILAAYYNRIGDAYAAAAAPLAEEVNAFVHEQRQQWTRDNIPVLISLGSRLKQLADSDPAITLLRNALLMFQDSEDTDRARQAIYKMLSLVLERESHPFMCRLLPELKKLWLTACMSEQLFTYYEIREVLNTLIAGLAGNVAGRLRQEIAAKLQQHPARQIQLPQATEDILFDCWLEHFNLQCRETLDHIERDSSLTEMQKMQAMEACGTQIIDEIENCDLDITECTQLLEASFTFAAASDAAIDCLNIEAQKMLYAAGSQIIETLQTKYRFLLQNPLFAKSIKRSELCLQLMKQSWSPFNALSDQYELIASFLPAHAFCNWRRAEPMVFRYFNLEDLFCEEITTESKFADDQKVLDRQEALFIKRNHWDSRYNWACQFGRRIKGLRLDTLHPGEELTALLENCPELIALDLSRTAIENCADLPFNLLQLKWLKLPKTMLTSDSFLKNNFLLEEFCHLGFTPSLEDQALVFTRNLLPDPIKNNSLAIRISYWLLYNPRSLLCSSLEKLTLIDWWCYSGFIPVFSKLSETCPKLKHLDLTSAYLSICFNHLDLTGLQKIEFAQESNEPGVGDLPVRLALFGFIKVKTYTKKISNEAGVRHCSVWEKKADFIPGKTLQLQNCSLFTPEDYLRLSRLYTELKELTIDSYGEGARTILSLVSPSTVIRVNYPNYFCRLQNDLRQLGFEDTSLYGKRWVNTNPHFTISGKDLPELETILANCSPKAISTLRVSLQELTTPDAIMELASLVNVLANRGVSTLLIERLVLDDKFIEELNELASAALQIHVNTLFLKKSDEIASFTQLLKQCQVNTVKFGVVLSENRLLKDIAAQSGQFPALCEIITPSDRKIPASIIEQGWFPDGKTNVILLSRNPKIVSLSAESAEEVSEGTLNRLLQCPKLVSIDITGQPASRQFVEKLMQRPIKEVINSSLRELKVAPELEKCYSFRLCLSQLKPGITLETLGLKDEINCLQFNPLQDGKWVLTDKLVAYLVNKIPAIKYLDLVHADLSQITLTGMKSLRKLPLEKVTVGKSTPLFVKAILLFPQLKELTFKQQLPFQDEAEQIFDKTPGRRTGISIELYQYEPIALSLLKHPCVASVKFTDCAIETSSGKIQNAFAKQGYTGNLHGGFSKSGRQK